MEDLFFEEQYEPDAETQDIVWRYESMVQQRSSAFLNEEEFEIIIEHYLRLNNLSKANEVADCASRTYPFSNEIKLRRAHTLLVRGDAYNAMQLLQALEYINVNDPDVLFLKARAYMQLGNRKEALRYFDKAVRESDDNAINYAYDAALELMDAQDYAAAIHYLKKSYDLEPSADELLNDMAFCYERLDDFKKSEELYMKFLRLKPFSDNTWYNLGTVYGRQKKYEEAIRAFEFAITANEENASAYFNLAMTFMYLQRYVEAIDVFKEFLTKEPETAFTFCLIGECYEELKNYEEAVIAYRNALGLKEDFAEAYYGLSMVYTALQQKEKAIESIIAALKIEPENPDYWCEYGKHLQEKGRNKEAIVAFQKTLEYNSYDTEAATQLAELKQTSASEEAMEKK